MTNIIDSPKNLVETLCANQIFKNYLRTFYEQSIQQGTLRQIIQSIVHETMESKILVTQSTPLNTQKSNQPDGQKIFKSTSTDNKDNEQEELEDQCLVEIDHLGNQIYEQLDKHVSISVCRQLFEVQQNISNKINMQIEDFKQQQLRVIQTMKEDIRNLYEKQNCNRKLFDNLDNINNNDSLKQNFSPVYKIIKQKQTQNQIIENRKMLTSQLLQYSRIEHKVSHQIEQHQIEQGQGMPLSFKNISDIKQNSSQSPKFINRPKNSMAYILNEQHQNLQQNQLSLSSQLQIQSKLSQLSEQSQKWLKQANKWYLHALSKVQKLQVQTNDMKTELMQKLQASFSGVWNVLTDIQQKMNTLNSKKK